MDVKKGMDTLVSLCILHFQNEKWEHCHVVIRFF
jgi:hypothetical protein